MTFQALRSPRKSPAYSVTAILTFGLGIGLTTAAFSLVNGLVLRPLPFPRPGELVNVHETSATELCSVGQRTREFGVRVAVGATAGQILRMVLAQGTKVTLAGAAVGVAGAAAATRLLRAILFGTDPLDPLVFAASAALLSAVMLVAMLAPARRASQVEPLIALRDE